MGFALDRLAPTTGAVPVIANVVSSHHAKECNMTFDINQDRCLQDAEWYRGRLKELMAFIGDKRSLSSEEVAECRRQLREIKLSFAKDKKSDYRRSGQMSPLEDQCLMTIQEASTRIRVSVNTHPLKSGWFDQLYEAKIDIDYFVDSFGASREHELTCG